MQVDASGNANAATVEVKIGSEKSDYEINNGSSLMAITAAYDIAQHAYVKVFDATFAHPHVGEHSSWSQTHHPSDPMMYLV